MRGLFFGAVLFTVCRGGPKHYRRSLRVSRGGPKRCRRSPRTSRRGPKHCMRRLRTFSVFRMVRTLNKNSPRVRTSVQIAARSSKGFTLLAKVRIGFALLGKVLPKIQKRFALLTKIHKESALLAGISQGLALLCTLLPKSQRVQNGKRGQIGPTCGAKFCEWLASAKGSHFWAHVCQKLERVRTFCEHPQRVRT